MKPEITPTTFPIRNALQQVLSPEGINANLAGEKFEIVAGLEVEIIRSSAWEDPVLQLNFNDEGHFPAAVRFVFELAHQLPKGTTIDVRLNSQGSINDITTKIPQQVFSLSQIREVSSNFGKLEKLVESLVPERIKNEEFDITDLEISDVLSEIIKQSKTYYHADFPELNALYPLYALDYFADCVEQISSKVDLIVEEYIETNGGVESVVGPEIVHFAELINSQPSALATSFMMVELGVSIMRAITSAHNFTSMSSELYVENLWTDDPSSIATIRKRKSRGKIFHALRLTDKNYLYTNINRPELIAEALNFFPVEEILGIDNLLTGMDGVDEGGPRYPATIITGVVSRLSEAKKREFVAMAYKNPDQEYLDALASVAYIPKAVDAMEILLRDDKRHEEDFLNLTVFAPYNSSFGDKRSAVRDASSGSLMFQFELTRWLSNSMRVRDIKEVENAAGGQNVFYHGEDALFATHGWSELEHKRFLQQIYVFKHLIESGILDLELALNLIRIDKEVYTYYFFFQSALLTTIAYMGEYGLDTDPEYLCILELYQQLVANMDPEHPMIKQIINEWRNAYPFVSMFKLEQMSEISAELNRITVQPDIGNVNPLAIETNMLEVFPRVEGHNPLYASIATEQRNARESVVASVRKRDRGVLRRKAGARAELRSDLVELSSRAHQHAQYLEKSLSVQVDPYILGQQLEHLIEWFQSLQRKKVGKVVNILPISRGRITAETIFELSPAAYRQLLDNGLVKLLVIAGTDSNFSSLVEMAKENPREALLLVRMIFTEIVPILVSRNKGGKIAEATAEYINMELDEGVMQATIAFFEAITNKVSVINPVIAASLTGLRRGIAFADGYYHKAIRNSEALYHSIRYRFVEYCGQPFEIPYMLRGSAEIAYILSNCELDVETREKLNKLYRSTSRSSEPNIRDQQQSFSERMTGTEERYKKEVAEGVPVAEILWDETSGSGLNFAQVVSRFTDLEAYSEPATVKTVIKATWDMPQQAIPGTRAYSKKVRIGSNIRLEPLTLDFKITKLIYVRRHATDNDPDQEIVTIEDPHGGIYIQVPQQCTEIIVVEQPRRNLADGSTPVSIDYANAVIRLQPNQPLDLRRFKKPRPLDFLMNSPQIGPAYRKVVNAAQQARQHKPEWLEPYLVDFVMEMVKFLLESYQSKYRNPTDVNAASSDEEILQAIIELKDIDRSPYMVVRAIRAIFRSLGLESETVFMESLSESKQSRGRKVHRAGESTHIAIAGYLLVNTSAFSHTKSLNSDMIKLHGMEMNAGGLIGGESSLESYKRHLNKMRHEADSAIIDPDETSEAETVEAVEELVGELNKEETEIQLEELAVEYELQLSPDVFSNNIGLANNIYRLLNYVPDNSLVRGPKELSLMAISLAEIAALIDMNAELAEIATLQNIPSANGPYAELLGNITSFTQLLDAVVQNIESEVEQAKAIFYYSFKEVGNISASDSAFARLVLENELFNRLEAAFPIRSLVKSSEEARAKLILRRQAAIARSENHPAYLKQALTDKGIEIPELVLSKITRLS